MRTKPNCADPVTLEEHFERASDVDVYGDSGICRHLPYLRSLVQYGDVVAELGVGGADQSTVAWLAGRPAMMYGYDVYETPGVAAILELAATEGVEFVFRAGDTKALPIVESDILFIDTFHKAETVDTELARFAPYCRRQIVFHDVVTFGRRGQGASPDQGINLAIADFLFTNRLWRPDYYSTADNGLLSLRRNGT